jgi:hypothetical protein
MVAAYWWVSVVLLAVDLDGMVNVAAVSSLWVTAMLPAAEPSVRGSRTQTGPRSMTSRAVCVV